jgi:hypothetical protein
LDIFLHEIRRLRSAAQGPAPRNWIGLCVADWAGDDRREAVFVQRVIQPSAVWLGVLLLGAPTVGAPARASAGAAQHWLTAGHAKLVADGQVHSFALPHPRSGPTTVAVAPDGRV